MLAPYRYAGETRRLWSTWVRPGVRLAVDVGSVRVGVARCDPGAMLASPLATVKRDRATVEAVAALVAEHEAVEVVVGLPAGLSGREGPAAAEARGFARSLAARLAVPVRLADERFTTVIAHGALRQAGHDSRDRRQTVDSAAAAVLLQAALDTERATGAPPGEIVSQAAGDGG